MEQETPNAGETVKEGDGELVEPSKELVVIDHANLPNPADVLLDYVWPIEAKIFIKSEEYPYEDIDKPRAYHELANHCVNMGLKNEQIYVILETVEERWDFLGESRSELIKEIISLARTHQGGQELAKLGGLENEILVYDWEDFMLTHFIVLWVVRGILLEAGTLAIAGPPGVGKTQFMLRLLIAIATGTPFLGYVVEDAQPRKVLFISLEMSHPELKNFLSKMEEGMTDEQKLLLKENFHIYPRGMALYLNNKEDQREYWRLLTEIEPEVIVIDSWSMAVMGNLSDDTVTRDAFAFINLIRQKFRCAVCIIHHTKKAQGDSVPNSLDDMYGSRFFSAQVATGIVLWPHKQSTNRIEIHVVKNRFEERSNKPMVVERNDSLNFSMIEGAKAKKQLTSGKAGGKDLLKDLLGESFKFIDAKTIPVLPVDDDVLNIDGGDDNSASGLEI